MWANRRIEAGDGRCKSGYQLEIDDREVLAALQRLVGASLEPAFRDIGEYLINSTQERFERQESPDGTPWAPLSPKYQARKRKNRDRILVLEGYLRDLLRYQAGPVQVELGTDRIQGVTHQFGRDEANIPARPFLRLSDDDRREVLAILADHLERAAAGNGV